jgi:mannose-1-phosphate guanylyltransferase
MKAMVLAAGVGSRLDPLTAHLPKPLVPVVNRPTMEHILELLKQHDVTQIVSNLHHLPEQISQYFGDGKAWGVNLEFHLEKELTGDAGGMRACRSFLQDGTFIVMMGDLLTDADISDLLKQHKSKGAVATIAVKRVEDVSQFGVVLTDENGFITGFQEKPSAAEALSNLASTGIYILEPEVFKYIPQTGSYGFGRQLFPLLVQKGAPVLGVEIENYWTDVGTISQYRKSNFDALEGKLKLKISGEKTPWGYLQPGCDIADNAKISGQLLLGANSVIGSGVKISGHVIIGPNCNIAEDCELNDTVVWPDTRIEPQTILKEAVIGPHCVVNGAARMREQVSVQ